MSDNQADLTIRVVENAAARNAVGKAATTSTAAGKTAAAGFWTTKSLLIAAGFVVALVVVVGLGVGLTQNSAASASRSAGVPSSNNEASLVRDMNYFDSLTGLTWKGVAIFSDIATDIATNNDGGIAIVTVPAGFVRRSEQWGTRVEPNTPELYGDEYSEPHKANRRIAMDGTGRCVILSSDAGFEGSGYFYLSTAYGKGWQLILVPEYDTATFHVAMDSGCTKAFFVGFEKVSVKIFDISARTFSDAPGFPSNKKYNGIYCDARCNTVIATVMDTGNGAEMLVSNDGGQTSTPVSSDDDDLTSANPRWNDVCISDDGSVILAVASTASDYHYPFFSNDGARTFTKYTAFDLARSSDSSSRYIEDGEKDWYSCTMSNDGTVLLIGTDDKFFIWSTTFEDGLWKEGNIDDQDVDRLACDATCDNIYAFTSGSDDALWVTRRLSTW